jgi:hypothetical protein
MLSAKLVQLIEDHWEGITNSILRQLRSDPKLAHIGLLPDSELRDTGRIMLKNLGASLTASRQDWRSLEEQYEGIGRVRFAENVPLHESVRALQIVKKKVVEFLRDHEFAQSTVAIYAEEELEHRLNEFFDDVIYYQVRGYEIALHQSIEARAFV